MFERFTRAATAAVKDAQRQAQAFHARQVRAGHLLLGVLGQRDPTVSGVLDAVGPGATALRGSLESRLGRYLDGLDEDDAQALRTIGIDLDEVTRRLQPDLPRSARRTLPGYSREAKKALQLALREAIALRHGEVAPEHILLGLARCGDRVVADSMTECGLDHRSLRRAVGLLHRRAG